MKTASNICRILLVTAIVLIALASGVVTWKTCIDLRPLPPSLTLDALDTRKVQIVDRHYYPLTVTYQNHWNLHDFVSLHDIPSFLQQAFVVAEDKRFFEHGGVDWIARLHALWQNLKAFGPQRGASTISEQVIRMCHPRPRTVWSRWLEGLEASRLETVFSKAEILEFYLNQVPYAARRRGVVQASHYYFNRDLDSLSKKEMLALAVLVRAPGRMDLRRDRKQIEGPLQQLAGRMLHLGLISAEQGVQIKSESLDLQRPRLRVQAGHFVRYLLQKMQPSPQQRRTKLRTTLDGEIQTKVQTILNRRLADLKYRQVQQGAALVIDHRTHEVLAWVNAGKMRAGLPGGWIDAVISPRQPGSTLKPFLYALALQKGWTAATIVEDEPLTKAVGSGLHSYRNYSRIHYGPLALRDALGNSLNIPAIRTIRFVGVEDFLNSLTKMGVYSLRQHPEHYGDGLALGNGEISLLELVQAYGVLADRGVYHPLRLIADFEPEQQASHRIFSCEVASIVSDILSDPQARRLEFGTGSLLQLPVQTAVKTGTSNDYRDAWAVGYNYRYTVGVWMGNLDHHTMDGVTGASGPALVLRAVFTELNRHQQTRPLYMSPRLVSFKTCRNPGTLAPDQCHTYNEWFVPGTEPAAFDAPDEYGGSIYLRSPTPGLQLAMDPRIPDEQEAFVFELSRIPPGATVVWHIDGEVIATTHTPHFLWLLQRGAHRVQATVITADYHPPVRTPWVSFEVK
jgi:penicillin-binding protein 1C